MTNRYDIYDQYSQPIAAYVTQQIILDEFECEDWTDALECADAYGYQIIESEDD